MASSTTATKPLRYSHCSSCGTPWPDARALFPRKCIGCGLQAYSNPLPVCLAMVPVERPGAKRGIVLIRRGIEPRKGKLAFPGGFLETGEDWKQGAAREAWEESDIQLYPEQLTHYALTSINDHPLLSHLLIFALHPPLQFHQMPSFTPNHEATERIVATDPVDKEEMAFPAHWQVLERWFEERDRSTGRM